ncbi:MFS transporter [Burkholderia sp. MR1-5-21]
MRNQMDSTALEASVAAKFMRHVMPWLAVMYLVAYIDRQNVSFAKLQMAADIGLSEYAYGLGASLFFIGYFLCEVPSNIMLGRFGPRRWFARILLTWGMVTIALGFSEGRTSFYVLRFLLGVCEAGFFPGVLYLLTVWLPRSRRARMIGLFLMASVVANMIGAPLCGALLDMLNGTLGLKGWQWVFICTGAPAVLLSVAAFTKLPDNPMSSHFMNQDEKQWLQAELSSEDRGLHKVEHASVLAALLDGRVLLIALAFIGFPLAGYGLAYWLPTVVKNFGVSNTVNGVVNILPWVCSILALWFVPRSSARTGEKTLHIVVPVLIAAGSLAGSVVIPGNVMKFVLLCVAAGAIFSAQPIFWTLPSIFLKGRSAAVGLAAINSIGSLGGFVAQTAVPAIRDATGSTLAPMFFLAGCLTVTAILTVVIQLTIGHADREQAVSSFDVGGGNRLP